MAEGLTMKDVPADLGWNNPALDQMNKQAQDLHERANMPIVETVMKAASPAATPEDRVAAGDFFKSANEARIGDVLGAIVDLNPRKLYVALTGGADVKEIGYDASMKPYEVIYNQRDELRGYRDPSTGKMLTPDELQAVGGITTKRDVTPERQKLFQSMGVSLADVAKARSDDFVQTKFAAREAGANADLIERLAQQNDVLTKRLSPASLDPKTLAFVRGISSIRTGDQQATRGVTDAVNELASGTKKWNDLSSQQKQLLGINLGLQYNESTGKITRNGKDVSTSEMSRLGNSYEQSQSSDRAVEARQQEMLARAQTMFAGKAELLNDITQLINNNSQISLAQNQIEKFGGIGVAKPNLVHQLGDSFMSARQKANNDEYYGAAARLFSNFVTRETENLPVGKIPDIGALRVKFANSPEMKELQKATAEKFKITHAENEAFSREINARQGATGLTNEPYREGVVPPRNATNPSAPRGSAPAPAEQPQRRSLGSIFGPRQ